jgi:hypothetical protein
LVASIPVSDQHPHSLDEVRETGVVPFSLKWVAFEGDAGTAVSVGEDGDLVNRWASKGSATGGIGPVVSHV